MSNQDISNQMAGSCRARNEGQAHEGAPRDGGSQASEKRESWFLSAGMQYGVMISARACVWYVPPSFQGYFY